MTDQIVVLAYGAVGRATTAMLLRQGRTVTVAQRTPPTDLPAGTNFRHCDVLDAQAVSAVVKGASQVVAAIGFQYDGRIWRNAWPKAMTNIVAACEIHRARLVFVDNLYMYGPQDVPLREDLPLTSFGIKPAVRSEITRIWMASAAAGKVKVATIRAPDFYGPGVALSQLGEQVFGALAKGKRATLIVPPDMPHDFAYVPDFARAVVTLLVAPDEDFGQAWHVPCAPIKTPREIIALGAAALGVKPRIMALPLWSLPVLGCAVPMLRAFPEMRFQWDRPYHVDARKFSQRFWSDATPFAIGAPATAISFRQDEVT